MLTGLITALPVLALGLVAWQLWGSALGCQRPLRVRDHVRRDRPGHHGRLPPPVHASLVQDRPAHARRVRDPRLDGDRGPGHRLGRRPSQAPRVLRPARRSAQAARRARPRPARRAERPRPRARRLAVHPHRTAGARRATRPTCITDPVVKRVNDQFVLWVVGGPRDPVLPRVRCSAAALFAGFTGMLWGGFVRMLVLHHVTYSINSLCHFFGRTPVRDRGRVAQPRVARAAVVRRGLAQRPPRVPDVGARTGSGAGSSTPSACVIAGLEKLGLAWDVVRIEPERIEAKRTSPDGVRERRTRCGAEIERALPDRPFAIALVGRRAHARHARRRPDLHGALAARASGTRCARPASSASAAPTSAASSRSTTSTASSRCCATGTRRRSTGATKRRLVAAALRAHGLTRAARAARRRAAPARAAGTRSTATRARCATTTTSPTSSSRCSSTRR